ncbi:MAG: DegQ family serine endoprotease [Rhodospirillales bacterium]|nr:DegQ family serine endoprotease [Rhodospirillales bacterium]MDE0379013.1 DegQ family serine endoprotease [Rhodospirillales bacterium]
MRFPLLLLAPVLLAALVGFAAPAQAHLAADEVPSLAPLVKEIGPSVVNIQVKGRLEQLQPESQEPHPFFDHPFFKEFFGERMPERRRPQLRRPSALGSGVIVDAENGYLLTNNHVIEMAEEITVTLTDRRVFEAELVGADPETDVALLKIDADSLTALSFADSGELQVGDYVVAIGNPFGLGQTVTAGIVSAVGRSGLRLESYEDFIQTDAAINVGNSGGALVNLKGELVGINTAIYAGRVGGNIGIGFAIPINMAQRIMDQLLTHGEIQRGRIGVQIQDLTPEFAEALGTTHQRGALVAQVLPGTPAEEAGILAGDVIVGMNGESVIGATDLRNKVGLLRVGDAVRLSIVRDGETMTIELAVGERGEVTLSAGSQIPQLEGVALGPLTPDSPLYDELKEGVVVMSVEVDTPAWNAGLREGDVIVEVNRQEVKDSDDILAVLEGSTPPLLLNVRRGEGARFILIP